MKKVIYETLSAGVLAHVQSAKRALVQWFPNQAMSDNPLENQLKNTDLWVPPRDLLNLNLYLWECDPIVCLKVQIQMQQIGFNDKQKCIQLMVKFKK